MPDFSKTRIFAGVPAAAMVAMGIRGTPKMFSAGTTLMEQGDPGSAMYVILDGRVRVERQRSDLGEPLVLAELGPGQVVGEIAVLDGEPRSATVTAVEETQTMELTADVLTDVMLQFPEVARALLRTLSGRLRSTDEFVEQALRRGRLTNLEVGTL